MDLDCVREIEEVSARAWPPLESRDVDGWILRAGGGVTGRANSVWPRGHHGAMTVEAKLSAADDFYLERGLPSLLQISAASMPDGIQADLARRDYEIKRVARSVQIAMLESLAAVGHAERARIAPSISDDWYDVVAQVNASFAEHPDVAHTLLDQVAQPSAYAIVLIDGRPAAAGRGVLDGDWLGVFNMATLPAYRRRGAAAAVLAALASWAKSGGASRAYLQMEVAGAAAAMLYGKAGFAHCYEYAFWGKCDGARAAK